MSACGPDIDETDLSGYSPLIWATKRGNLKAVRNLLEAGANPNTITFARVTPLHFAAHGNDLVCVKLLLSHGANASCKNTEFQTPLHYGASARSSSNIIKTFLAAGIDTEERDICGATALSIAAIRNNVLGMTTLLDHGANIDTQDNDGDTPLIDAVSKCCNGSIELLLKRGANHIVPNKNYDTILHKAAQSGDMQTVNIIRAANLKGLDPYARNCNGETPLEIAQQRFSKPEGFVDLFLVLLFEIRNRNDHLAGNQNRRSGKAGERHYQDDDDDGQTSEVDVFLEAREHSHEL